ncbi:hypothetical protein MUN78_10665 [Leucobacter allii]|uniref:Uncharacterized protein n=1 Tax=Leucobacter allii TaxID=2932247 RepID=A0ABY4FJJ2_9MICO|nr:hypothetical protein [Leucobacter allii]UOQ56157.1 hypothetical protein MUN78_10665 [Leucobacter allii]
MSSDPVRRRPRAPEVHAATEIPEAVDTPEAVERWERAGGAWRIAEVGADAVSVELLRCDGGEVADLLRLTGERDIRWARARRAIEGGPA